MIANVHIARHSIGRRSIARPIFLCAANAQSIWIVLIIALFLSCYVLSCHHSTHRSMRSMITTISSHLFSAELLLAGRGLITVQSVVRNDLSLNLGRGAFSACLPDPYRITGRMCPVPEVSQRLSTRACAFACLLAYPCHHVSAY